MKNHLTLAFGLLLLVSGAAVAQTHTSALPETPEAQWPFLDTVCDDQTGAAFGLCLAYCEAMECDLGNDLIDDTHPNAPTNACERVRGVYQRIVGEDVPCECPCWNDADILPVWGEYLRGEAEAFGCLLDADVCTNVGAPTEWCTPPLGDAWVVFMDGGRTIQHTALGVFNILPPSCGQGGPPPYGGNVHDLSVSQGIACGDQLNILMAQDNLVCGF